jgi:hypothetical protein
MALQPNSGPGLPLWGFVTITFYSAGLLVQRPTPNLEDQASIFMTPGDRVAQLYPQALGTHFSRLLRHAWFTVGYSLIPATTRDVKYVNSCYLLTLASTNNSKGSCRFQA